MTEYGQKYVFIKAEPNTDLRHNVVAHEIGHALFMIHNNTCNSSGVACLNEKNLVQSDTGGVLGP